MDKSRDDNLQARRQGVGGRLKRRLAQVLLRSSCTTTTSAAAFVTNAAAPASASSRRQPPPNGPCSSHEPSTSAHALVRISIDDCSHGVGAGTTTSSRRPVPAKDVVVRAGKSRSRRSGNGDRPRPPSYRYSCTLTDDDELAAVSSDGERRRGAETRSTTLFSSLSLSSDSTTSDLYASTRRPKHHMRKPPRGAFRTPAVKHGKDADKALGGVVGGMAVVKRSRNPYADFKSSMVEMVVEQRIRGADGMGELLLAYLSLNSPRHHQDILAAFEAVWKAVFDLQQGALINRPN